MRMASSFHSKACREGRLSSRYGFEKGGWCLVIGYRINACKLHRTALITVPAGGQKNGGQKNKRRHFSVRHFSVRHFSVRRVLMAGTTIKATPTADSQPPFHSNKSGCSFLMLASNRRNSNPPP